MEFLYFLSCSKQSIKHFDLEDNCVESLDIINEVSFEVLDIYLKIFLLLYADDTVLMSENVNGMQTMLNIFSEYCNTWAYNKMGETKASTIFN
jgi:hypothetical protein